MTCLMVLGIVASGAPHPRLLQAEPRLSARQVLSDDPGGWTRVSLLGLGRVDDARTALIKALVLNPWLPERRLADPGGPLAPKGETL